MTYVLNVTLTYSWTLLYLDDFMLLFFVKVSEHAGTSKYHDKNIGSSSTCFLQIITVP